MATLIRQPGGTGLRRMAEFAGHFYASDPLLLSRDVDRLLRSAPALHTTAVRGLIVPHAGHPCSGLVAATAYRTLRVGSAAAPRFYLLGPTHSASAHGAALSSAAAFETPLGAVAVDREAVDELSARADLFHFSDQAHEVEHCLEVQLPFLQRLLHGRGFTIVPILIDDEADPAALADVLHAVTAGRPARLVIVTSDLSHNRSYAEAYARDSSLVAAIVAGDVATVARGEACGLHALLVLMHLAHRSGWRSVRLAYLTSGDTCGPRESVVGYASIAFTGSDGARA